MSRFQTKLVSSNEPGLKGKNGRVSGFFYWTFNYWMFTCEWISFRLVCALVMRSNIRVPEVTSDMWGKQWQ